MRLKQHFAFVLLFTLSAGTQAYAESKAPSANQGWAMSGHLGFGSIDSTTAVRQGIDESALVVNVSADYVQDNWITSVGGDIFMYDDNNEFEQDVIGSGAFNDGERSTKSSSARGVLIFAATGYQWLVTEQKNVALRLQGGYAHMVSSERAIGSCTNCFSQDIDVDGGVYIKASAMRNVYNFSVGIFAQQYMSGDISNVIGISAATQF